MAGWGLARPILDLVCAKYKFFPAGGVARKNFCGAQRCDFLGAYFSKYTIFKVYFCKNPHFWRYFLGGLAIGAAVKFFENYNPLMGGP